MPVTVRDGANLRSWPTEYKEDFLQAILKDEEIKIDRIVTDSNTDLEIDFDVETFSKEGLEELEKLKSTKIYSILEQMGEDGRLALSNIKETPAYSKYKDYTLGDIIDDDYKRNQLIGYSTFAYEMTGSYDDEDTDWKDKFTPVATLGTKEIEAGQQMKGVPDLDPEKIPLPIEGGSERLSEILKKLKDKGQYPVVIILEDSLIKEQKRHLEDFYDNIVEVREDGPTNSTSKEMDLTEENIEEKVTRYLSGNLNPSIIGPVEISFFLNEEKKDDDKEVLGVTVRIEQEQTGRFEVRPFGGSTRETLSRKMTQEEFVDFIEENKEEIEISDYSREDETYNKKEKLDSIPSNILKILIEAATNKKSMEEALSEINPDNEIASSVDSMKVIAAIRTIKSLNKELTGKVEGVQSRVISGYRANIRMDIALQDIEERYVNLEDDIENSSDFIGGSN